MLVAVAWLSVALAGLPALLFVRNLRAYLPPPDPGPSAGPAPSISVLIPARDEEGAIEGGVASALASRGVSLEVIVLDDHSRDATATIVAGLSAADARVRLLEGPP